MYVYNVPTKQGSLIEMTSFKVLTSNHKVLQPVDLGAHIYENPDADLDDFKATPLMEIFIIQINSIIFQQKFYCTRTTLHHLKIIN